MKEKLTTAFTHGIKDLFQSDWTLLSETEKFIAATPLQQSYEQQFIRWRQQLQSTCYDDIRAAVRGEIVALRKELRLQGYDLSLASVALVVKGFVNDDAAARGYKRAVICFCDTGIFWTTGQANHQELAEYLLDELERKRLSVHPETHYVWYIRKKKLLLLSGAATETAQQFERLQTRVNANPQKVLRYLKDLY